MTTSIPFATILDILPSGVVVARRSLEAKTGVRIPARQHKNKESDALAFGDFTAL